jgi:V8-like Glu-specific endopeptidase
MAAATPEPGRVITAQAKATATPVPDRLPGISAAPAKPKKSAATRRDGGVRPLIGSGAALWTPHGQMPALSTGKIYFTRTDGSGGYCTGSVITASNLNTVWTAGHCINAGSGGGYFSNFSFVPDTDNGSAPWGTWSWKYANTTVGWQNNGDWHYDVAAIAFWPTNGVNLQSMVGAQGYRFGFGQSFSVTDFGYPQSGYNRSDFPANGSKLYYCSGQTYRKSSSDDMIGLSCDMHHGASGGPWLTELASWGGGYIVGAYSSRDVNSSGVPINIEARSANHGDGAINVYNDVSTH